MSKRNLEDVSNNPLEGCESHTQWTHESLVLPVLEAHTSTEVIRALGGLLFQQGYVRDTFVEAVIEREKVFATGLPTPEIQVAIPHADVEHVIRPAIAIGVLKDPVEFGEMGNPDAVVRARLVCMLAVSESEILVSLLQCLVGVFQDKIVLNQIVGASDAERIAAIFNDRLPTD